MSCQKIAVKCQDGDQNANGLQWFARCHTISSWMVLSSQHLLCYTHPCNVQMNIISNEKKYFLSYHLLWKSNQFLDENRNKTIRNFDKIHKYRRVDDGPDYMLNKRNKGHILHWNSPLIVSNVRADIANNTRTKELNENVNRTQFGVQLVQKIVSFFFIFIEFASRLQKHIQLFKLYFRFFLSLGSDLLQLNLQTSQTKKNRIQVFKEKCCQRRQYTSIRSSAKCT